MATQLRIATGVVDHLRLTVTDVDRARAFYTDVLGFQVVAPFPSAVLLTNGAIMLTLGLAPDRERAGRADRFDESRVGLDHLSLRVADRAALEAARALFAARGVTHGEIKDLGAHARIYILAIRDPDNIQLELSAPYGDERAA